MEHVQCWKCGTLNEFPELKIGRRDECRQCNASLHACRQCRFYAPEKHNQCREQIAERVTDKTRANFCDYFVPNPSAYTPADLSKAAESQQRLDAIFDTPATTQPIKTLDDLFH